MRMTMKDVAKMAGVSIKTVSRIVNNEFNGTSEIRDRVQLAIKTLNFHPSKAAQRLAGSKILSIGLAYINPNAYYVVDLQEGLLACCNALNHELFILPCGLLATQPSKNDGDEYHQENQFVDLVIRSQLSGVVLTPPFSENNYIIEKLTKKNITFVAIVSGKIATALLHNDNKTPYIFLNDEKAAQQMTLHLVQSGHENIAFIGGNIDHNSSKNRLLGYQKALKSCGLQVSDNNIIEGEYSFTFGIESAKKLLSQPEKPSAIFAGNDEIAAGAIFAAQQLGINVPEDLSIVGFENSPFSRQTFPALTTLDIPTIEMAKNAGEILINKITKPQLAINSIEYNPNIILRESTGVGPMAIAQTA